MILHFFFPIEPKAMQSLRVARCGKFMRTYQPKGNTDWKTFVRLSAQTQLPPGWLPSDEPCIISTIFCFTLPKSACKRDRLAIEEGHVILKSTIPDFDNSSKGTWDSLSGLVWANDARICGVTDSYKVYANRNGIALTVDYEIDHDRVCLDIERRLQNP